MPYKCRHWPRTHRRTAHTPMVQAWLDHPCQRHRLCPGPPQPVLPLCPLLLLCPPHHHWLHRCWPLLYRYPPQHHWLHRCWPLLTLPCSSTHWSLLYCPLPVAPPSQAPSPVRELSSSIWRGRSWTPEQAPRIACTSHGTAARERSFASSRGAVCTPHKQRVTQTAHRQGGLQRTLIGLVSCCCTLKVSEQWSNSHSTICFLLVLSNHPFDGMVVAFTTSGSPSARFGALAAAAFLAASLAARALACRYSEAANTR